jgi:hypothetical protein
VEFDEHGNPTYQGREVMRFPIKGESEPNNYVCMDEVFRFPGLSKNKKHAKNYEKFRSLPCCFRVDQSDKVSHFLKYYHPDEYESRVVERKPKATVSTHVLTTFKFVGPERRGTLPSDVAEFFRLNGYNAVFRLGVILSPSSLIHCVMRGIMQQNYLANDPEKTVTNVRNNLLGRVNIAVSAQELWDQDNPIRTVQDTEEYLEPRKYYRLIEEYFGINIIVFEKTEDFPNGRLQPPAFYPPFMRYIYHDRQTLYIFEHMGAPETDRAKYPQCELIVRQSQDNFVAFFGDIYTNALTTLNLMTRTNVLATGEKVAMSVDLPEGYITGQLIDTLGKVQMITLNSTRTGYIAVILDHIFPPLNVPVISRLELSKLSKTSKINDVAKLVQSTFAKVGEYSLVVNLIGDAIYGLYVDDLGYIPLTPRKITSDLDKIPKISSIILFEKLIQIFSEKEEDNFYDSSLMNKKITDQLKQLTVIQFSKFVREKEKEKEKKLKDKIDEFSQVGFKIETPFILDGPLSRSTGIDNPLLDEQGVIKVPSSDIIHRLIYYLRIYVNDDPSFVKKSFDQKFINNFYENPKDFVKEKEKEEEEERIFTDLRTMYMYMNYRYNFVINSSDSIAPYNPSDRDPYLLKHRDIERGITLMVQPVFNGEQRRAMAVSHTWQKYGSNLGFFASPIDENLPTRIYDVATRKITGNINDLNALVLFVDNDTENGAKYMSILPL